MIGEGTYMEDGVSKVGEDVFSGDCLEGLEGAEVV